jgi:hypothetical protein
MSLRVAKRRSNLELSQLALLRTPACVGHGGYPSSNPHSAIPRLPSKLGLFRTTGPRLRNIGFVSHDCPPSAPRPLTPDGLALSRTAVPRLLHSALRPPLTCHDSLFHCPAIVQTTIFSVKRNPGNARRFPETLHCYLSFQFDANPCTAATWFSHEATKPRRSEARMRSRKEPKNQKRRGYFSRLSPIRQRSSW